MFKKSNYTGKNLFERVWYFLWSDESLISWLVLLALSVFVILFVFFPLSGLILSSKLPYVVIETGSMVHHNKFDNFWAVSGEWYEDNNITKEEFSAFKFKNGLNIGDIIVLKGSENYSVGDIIVFAVPYDKPVIHRIVNVQTKCYNTNNSRDNIFEIEEYDCYAVRTKGDANLGQLKTELNITKERIIGKAVFRIPKAGYVKLIPCSLFSSVCNFIDNVRR